VPIARPGFKRRREAIAAAAPGRRGLLAQRYLEHRSLPREALLTVGGYNTYENLREAEALAQREGLETMLVVSERFHMLRSLTMAEDLGMQAYGSPTRTSLRERNPAWRLYYTLREVSAYSAYSLLGLKSPTPA
jgi:uncharacterized SAM-binding protein YcdF (DUF218 family)